ncbi:hypothetical protein ACN38_g1906 [Penicillium nordicum]|uniref:Uncharacterized protein n=1 Tax=Penicillium nordicum TaxID=229535 RepID=A0A0M8PGC0_9EURO|nr:hypothetical protein ACN38_g1906 [Penicillium nordicum]
MIDFLSFISIKKKERQMEREKKKKKKKKKQTAPLAPILALYKLTYKLRCSYQNIILEVQRFECFLLEQSIKCRGIT